MKRMRLRYAGTCRACRAALAAGTSAWWDPVSRQVSCVTCQASVAPTTTTTATPTAEAPTTTATPTAEVPTTATAATTTTEAPAATPITEATSTAAAAPQADVTAPLDRGAPGASARREGERRAARREERIRARHPRLGGLVLAVTDEPRSTKVWATGALGEAKVGAALEAAADLGIAVLHDRRIPRSRANIDHLVVAGSGVWVVDAKRYSGRMQRRDVGGWFRTDERLYVGGRDKTALIEGVRRQVEAVHSALAHGPWAAVPVHGALCFVDTDVGVFAKPFVLDGVLVSWRRKLIPVIADGDALGTDERDSLLRELATRFPAA